LSSHIAVAETFSSYTTRTEINLRITQTKQKPLHVQITKKTYETICTEEQNPKQSKTKISKQMAVNS
jgi:hypothetical protein